MLEDKEKEGDKQDEALNLSALLDGSGAGGRKGGRKGKTASRVGGPPRMSHHVGGTGKGRKKKKKKKKAEGGARGEEEDEDEDEGWEKKAKKKSRSAAAEGEDAGANKSKGDGTGKNTGNEDKKERSVKRTKHRPPGTDADDEDDNPACGDLVAKAAVMNGVPDKKDVGNRSKTKKGLTHDLLDKTDPPRDREKLPRSRHSKAAA